MVMFIAVTVVVSFLSLVVFLSAKMFGSNSFGEKRNIVPPSVFLLISLVLLCDISLGGNYILRMTADMALAVIPMLTFTSSMWKLEHSRVIIKVCLIAAALYVLYYVLCLCGVLPLMTDKVAVSLLFINVVAAYAVHILSLWLRIYEIKELMKAGTVWSYLCQSVDSIYMMSMLSAVMSFLFCCCLTGSSEGVHVIVLLVLLWMEMMALGLRVAFDSEFVIMQKHERVIVESMRISQVEVTAAGAKTDAVYRDIYERVLLHFEMQKPFLDNNLTINDVVSVVYSNKVYISKAISHYTGRNFRQFVNYYRVMYSMELFRRQPDMRVAELAGLSGFNSLVSYASAFRLFMNETPSEWCRKERTKIIKMKK